MKAIISFGVTLLLVNQTTSKDQWPKFEIRLEEDVDNYTDIQTIISQCTKAANEFIIGQESDELFESIMMRTNEKGGV